MSQSATQRSLDILERLAGEPDGLALAEICAALSMPKSVGHRLLALLAQRGYVRQDPGSGRYGLTLKLTLLGVRHYAGTGLSDVSQPILDRLAAGSGELARLAVVEGERMLWVAKAQGARYGLRYDPSSGHHVPLHATAVGKAWLATLPEDEAARIVAATKFATPAHCGPNVMRTVAELRRALKETRARGYGVALEEGEPGMAAVAVVVRASADARAPAVGTLSLAGPVSRFTAARRKLLARELIAAARELSALWPMRGALRSAAATSASDTAHHAGGAIAHVV